MLKVGMTLMMCLAAATFAVAPPRAATAQVNCVAIPAGPARTDRYIGLSRINRGNAEIAGSKARVETDAATLRQVTGKRAKVKPRRKAPRPPAPR